MNAIRSSQGVMKNQAKFPKENSPKVNIHGPHRLENAAEELLLSSVRREREREHYTRRYPEVSERFRCKAKAVSIASDPAPLAARLSQH